MVQYVKSKKNHKFLKYRIVLGVVLLLLIAITVWYCFSCMYKTPKKQEGLFVYHEQNQEKEQDEGQIIC